VIVNDDLCFTDNLDEGDNYLLANNTFGWLYSINASDQYKPALFDGDVNPKTGNQSTLITYTVNYTDPDNNGPREINVVINGSSYAMWKQDIQDYNFTDGCIYEFSTYLLHPGLYNYSFNCFDGKYTNETSTYWNPTVSYTNEDPLALTDGAVEPLEGEAGITTFYFTVNYTDSDNNFLVSINITLDGVNYTMTQVDPSDVNYMDGCLFFYSTKLGGITTHEFNFTAFDGIYYDFDGTFNNPKTNDTTGPLIDNITASPLVGDQGTIFNFTVDLWDYSGIYSALGYITYLNDTFIETITFWDDGNHNDGGNGDGIFGASWDSSGFSQGVYLLDINATDSMIYHYESLYENFTFGIVNWACQAGMEYRWNMTSVPFGPEMTGFHIIYNVSEITITSALMSFVMGNIALYNFTSAQIIGYTNKIELENYNLTTQLFSQPSLPGLPFPQLTLPFLVVPFDLEKVNDSIINFRSYPANANFSLYYENNTIMYEYSMYGYTYVEVYQWNDLGMMNRTILFINNLLYLQYDYLGPDEAPPNLEYVEILPEIEVEGTPFNITAKVVDYWGVKNVSAIITYPDFSTDVMIMYDDGNHNDGFNGDGIFGASWDSTGKSPDVYNVSINATDINGFWKYFDNVANFTVTATDISSPLVLDSNVAPLIVAVNENGIFNITAYVWDPSGISSVIATIKYSNNTIIENVTMYDDGAHNDGFAGDWVFGGNWSTNSYPKGIYYLDIFCNDSDANEKVYINETEFVIVNWTVSSGDVYVYNVTYNDFPFGALAPFYVFPAGYLFRVDVKDINSTFVSYPGPDDFVLRFWGDIYELNETAYWTQLAALDYIIDANITLNYYVSNILNVVGIPIFPSFLPTPIRLTTLMWLTQTNIFYSGYPPSMISYTYNETSLHMKLQLVYDLKLTYTAKGVLIKYEFIYLGYRFVVELILDEKNEDNGQLVDPTFTLLDENTGDFTVNYYNTKGIYPLNVTININGTSYLMNQIDPSDFNYIDGATYRLTHPITWGNYYNYFITYFDGNYSHSTTPTIIRAIDLTPPQNTSIIINSGDYYTTNSLVTLTLNATDVIEMRFKNETGMWSDWEAYNITKKCYLSEGYGSKTIWVVFRDKYSNEADAISDTIVKLGPNGVFLKSSGINVINKSDLGIYVEIETTQVGFMDVRKLTADELNITRPWTNFTAVYYFSFEVYDTDYILSSDIVINATVRIYYNPFVIGNVDNLHLLKYVGNDTWESIEFTINREEYYIEFNTSSFSIYSLGEIPPLFDPFLIIAIVIAIISIISFSLVSFVVVKKKQKKKVPSIRSKKTIKTPFWVSEEEQALKPIPKKKAESELIAKEERTPEEIAELEKTEKEIGIEKEKFMCIVHRGKIVGNIYVCPNCQAIYCQNCAKSLKQKGESCWSCENEIEIDLFESEAKNNDEM
jgi:hypothetical protein